MKTQMKKSVQNKVEDKLSSLMVRMNSKAVRTMNQAESNIADLIKWRLEEAEVTSVDVDLTTNCYEVFVALNGEVLRLPPSIGFSEKFPDVIEKIREATGVLSALGIGISGWRVQSAGVAS